MEWILTRQYLPGNEVRKILVQFVSNSNETIIKYYDKKIPDLNIPFEFPQENVFPEKVVSYYARAWMEVKELL